MRQQWVMANWKMNGTKKTIMSLLEAIKAQAIQDKSLAHTVIFPPAPYLFMLEEYLEDCGVAWGAQNVSAYDEGAYTGECSVRMLQDFKGRYALIGHSERRQLFQEGLETVTKKCYQAKKYGIIPVLCIGETLEERTRGATKAVLKEQISHVFSDPSMHLADSSLIIAYEPVWAIGTGKTAAPEAVDDTHAYVRELIEEYVPGYGSTISILYGGSISSKNAEALFSMPNIDGGLVGGASLDAAHFLEIVSCIKR